ncbi:MAG TPA: alpha/beta fold hydrolase [Ktedonobacterales bacterium]|jgi:carboxylesterase
MKGDGRPAALLVHGFNGEPMDMVEVERDLRARGFATRNLTLPGHGLTARHFARTTWADWSAAVLAATSDLLERHPHVILAGHSMGGALVLHAAANEPRVSGVVALCPPLHMWFAQTSATAALHRVLPYVPTFHEDVHDPTAALRYARKAYRWTPLAPAHSLFCTLRDQVQHELPHVRCPALVACSLRDHVVPARDGIEIYRRLGTLDKELLVLEQSFHVIMKDLERDQVCARVGAFAERAVAHALRQRAATGSASVADALPAWT